MTEERSYFRLCSSCKKQLPFGAHYYTCSVSTCNRAKDPLTFCSVPCFSAHVPVIRHREAWAEEQTAPSREQWLSAERERAESEARAAQRPERAEPRAERRIVSSAEPRGPIELNRNDLPRDVLIVVSKLKAYIRARSGMNTSDGAMDVLSDIVREIADQAIQKAAAEGRKTVLDRDF